LASRIDSKKKEKQTQKNRRSRDTNNQECKYRSGMLEASEEFRYRSSRYVGYLKRL